MKDLAWWAKHGMIGGVIGGIAFAVYEVAYSTLTKGVDAALTPLRLIGAIALGPHALDPSYPPVRAAVVGAGVHLMFAALFGVIFAAIVWTVPALAESRLALVVAASAYGFAVWAVTFHFIAPWVGWAWLPAASVRWVQVLAHTFGFGTVLGLYLDGMIDRPRARVDRAAIPPPLRKAG